MLRAFSRPSTLTRHLPAAFHPRFLAARHPHLTAAFSGIEGQSHSDPLIPHPLPSPHSPPSVQPPSTLPREEYEKRTQRREEEDRKHVAEHEAAATLEVLVDVTDATAEAGKEEVDDKVAAALELLNMKRAEEERVARQHAQVATKRDAQRRAEQAGLEEQRKRHQADRERKEAREGQQRAVEAQRRAEQLAEEDKKASAAKAQQSRAEEQRRADKRRQQQLQQHQQTSSAMPQSSKPSARSQQTDQLRAKQEKERAERARWLAAQPAKASTAPPAATTTTSTATPTVTQQSTAARSEEMRRKEEAVVREARVREQLLGEKQRAVVREERERAARQAQQQQAAQQQAAAQVLKESWDKQKAKAQAAVVEEERKRQAAILQQQEAERERREEQLAMAHEKQRKLDAANREEAERKAAAQQAEKNKRDEAVQREQQRQQADLIAALRKDHLPSSAEFSTNRSSAARAAVVLTPGATPPSGGGGGGPGVVVATPSPEVVMRTERPDERQQREDKQGAWLTYALIGAGGGLVVLYALLRKRETEVGTRITATEYVLPANMVQKRDGRDTGVSQQQTQPASTVVDNTVPPSLLSLPIAPPPLPPLPAPLPLPTLDESAFPDLSKSAPVSETTAHPTVESETSLIALLNSLQTLQLQDLLASLTRLETDEAHYLRSHIHSALTRHLSQLQAQVADLSSGVTVSVDAPLLSHSSETDKAKLSVEELQKHLASLQRQYDTLTHGGSALSANANRATSEASRQMEALFSSMLNEQRQHAEQLITQILSIERSLTQSALASQSELAIDDSISRAIEEERERWQDVERSELHAQRDDLLTLSRLYLLRQRAEMDRVHDAVRQHRMGEWREVSVRMRGLLSAFSRLVRDTAVSERLHAVALAALTLESIEREEELEDEEDRGRIRAEDGSSTPIVTTADRAEEWRRLWRLRSEDEVIDAAVSALPSHVLEHGVESSKELKRQWRRVQYAMKEEAFVPKTAGEAEQGRSVWAQLVGTVFSLLYLSPSAAAAAASGGADEVEVLDRMNACVVNRRWQEALRMQQQLSSNNRQLSQRWRQAVQDRMLVEQTLSTVRARIICLSLDV